MKRQNIILGDYTYIVDHYTYNVDFKGVCKEFAIIRNNEIVNTISYDKDVYFIEYDLIKNLRLNPEDEYSQIDIEKLSKIIAFPITTKTAASFSSDLTKFNYTFTKDSFIEGIDINVIKDKNYNNAQIPCDKLRIYLPANNPELQAIVCVSNYINNVHFYYLCRPLNQYNVQSETELKVNNIAYSEFFDIDIPNIDYLLSEGTHYIAENFNLDSIKNTIKYVKNDDENIIVNARVTTKNDADSLTLHKTNAAELELISNNIDAFNLELKDGYDLNKKLKCSYKYISISFSELDSKGKTYSKFIEDLVKLNPLYIIHDVIDKTHIDKYDIVLSYLTDDTTTVSFTFDSYKVTEYKTLLKYVTYYLTDKNILKIDKNAKQLNIIIDNHSYSFDTTWLIVVDENTIITDIYTLVLPFLIEPVNTSKTVYQKVYSDDIKTNQNSIVSNFTVCLYQYDTLSDSTNLYVPSVNTIYNADVFEIDNQIKLKANFTFNNDYAVINSVFEHPYLNKMSLFSAYSKLFAVNINDYINFVETDDIELDFDTNIQTVGYRIEIANDIHFKNIIYVNEELINVKEENGNFIDDFQFALNNIFSNWDNLPDVLVCRTMFIDKVIMNIIYSNTIHITKEQFKFLINETKHKLTNFKDLANDITIDSEYMKKFNFIDKITCVVNKTETGNQISVKNTAGPKIIYKPIFFKVADLQTIKIKSGLKQNIGINLSDLMTKVESFKLKIDGLEYVESSRNDVYVLFSINAADLSSSVGTYTIVNQDDEYLSDGNWTTY